MRTEDVSGAHFKLKHSCPKSGRTYSPEWRRPRICRACMAGVPVDPPSMNALQAAPVITTSPTHYARFEGALCGVLRPLRAERLDERVTCVGCLLVRMAMLGMPIAERTLRRAAPKDDHVALLRRAVRSASRLRAWQDGRRRSGP